VLCLWYLRYIKWTKEARAVYFTGRFFTKKGNGYF
jgi:hypothetical protein